MIPVSFRRLSRALSAALLLSFACAAAAPAHALSFDSAPQQRRPARQPRQANATARELPSPRSVLGFTPGDDRTIADWSQILDYFTRLDRASDRLKVQRIGTTTLGKPLVAAFISSPENIRELDRYREIQRRLADPRTVSNEAERDRLISEGRTVVVISCSIHSTEIVASQMSMQLAYNMAAARDEATREILRNTILILIPSANPDGVDIVAQWYRRSLGQKWEGTEPPELYHHYAGHDNNRDWFMLNLRETRDISRLLWREWFPQVVYDVHQQGATDARMMIPPFYDPANPHIAPQLIREVGAIGLKMAADLQAAGFQGAITNAKYDMWWHGGFRSAPYYHNSIGILTEAASARLMTPVNITPEQLARTSSRGMPSALETSINFPDPWPGGLWRPRDILEMELTTARSLLTLASKFREHYLRNFYELGRRALSYESGDARPLAYLIPAGQGRDESVAKLVAALVGQGVEVHRMERELHMKFPHVEEILTSGRDSSHGAHSPGSPIEVPLGGYVVFLAQPFRANVQALFEPQVYPNRRGPSGEAERPYDVAGWTLPMQMGVKYFPVSSIVEPESERRLSLVRDEEDVRRDLGLRVRAGEASPIRNPVRGSARVALYRSWTGSMDEGWTRYVFDTFNVPHHTLRDAEVRAGNLRSRFDVIILPSMRTREIVEGRAEGTAPPELTRGVGDEGTQNIRRFVEDGGTLVVWDDSTDFAIEKLKLPLRNVLAGLKTSEFYGPGSILRAEVDTSHPFARGLTKETDVYFIHGAAFDISDPARVRVVARFEDDKDAVLRSGWLLGPQHLAGRAALVEVGHGRGRVVLFGFRPQHRGQAWGTLPFIFNALSDANAARN